MFGLGVQELLLILVIILIFFGADKIPQLARSLGKGMNEFRKAQQELKAELEQTEPTVVPAVAAAPGEEVVLKPTYTICPVCQGKTVEGSLYCSNCGRPLTGQPVCKVCRRSYLDDEKYCANCGDPRIANQG